MRMTSRILTAAALVAGFAMTSVSAQAQNVRVRGTIEKVDGNNVDVKSRDGAPLKLMLKDNANVRGVVKASLADVKASTNVAITSRPRPDGTLEAVELRIFPPGAVQLLSRRVGPDAEQPNDQRLVADLGRRCGRSDAYGDLQGCRASLTRRRRSW